MTESISIMTPLQQMFHRRGMYIGGAENPEILAKELIDNALDELLCGYADRIEFDWDLKEGWFRIRDNGRGMPLSQFHTEDQDMSGLNGAIQARLLFTRPFSSGKYDKNNYKYSSGTNGVGIKAVNVFSTKTEVRVKDKKLVHNGDLYHLTLGWTEPERVQTIDEQWIDASTIEDFWWSTEVKCYPNMEVFKTIKCKIRETQLQLAKTSKPNCKIVVNGEEIKPFSFRESVTNDLLLNKTFKVNVTVGYTNFEIELGWSSKDFNSYYRGAVNLGSCNEGWHIKETKYAVGRVLAGYDDLLTNSDAEYGLRMFINCLISEPIYTSQTKEKLAGVTDFDVFNEALMRKKYADLIEKDENGRENVVKAKEAVKNDPEFLKPELLYAAIQKAVKKELDQDESFKTVLVKRIVEYKKSVQKLSEQSFINSIVKTGNHKIARNSVVGIKEAGSADRAKCELFICEGKSAEGNLLQKRDRMFQAVFPLRGKPLNAANVSDIKQILENREMKTLVNGIGAGILPQVDLTHARYGKLIILTDADPDGKNIEALIIGALLFLNPKVIEAGMLYTVAAPLYKQDGKLLYSEKDLNMKKKFKRFKGLGSMMADELEASALKSTTRKLRQITLTEAREKALEIITSSHEKKRIMTINKILVE
ncbi:DNA gyrase subunit B protein [Rhizobium phage RHph_TM39]|nr:DNA gyrase subunit B protein [Rhizobium phage RHph_TM39]QIG77843.1 DNA gyrase subunit B protein [Rhizobium phage RHph_TM61]